MTCPAMRKRANSEWRIGMALERSNDQFLQGSQGVAGCHGLGRVLLPINRCVSEGRDVRLDFADQAIRRVYSRKHRRGTRTGKYRELHPIPAHCTGIFEGTGDSSHSGRACGDRKAFRSRAGVGTVRWHRAHAARAHSITSAKKAGALIRSLFAIPHSLFAAMGFTHG